MVEKALLAEVSMLTYIDLFCGIGGFRQGIERVCKTIGEEPKCLFACDNDSYASKVYKRTYGEDVFFDIKSPDTHALIDDKIKKLSKRETLDFIFAGFPCQSFSKAGHQEGFNDEKKGNLFFEIIKIAEKHKPKFMLLENVRNLKSHDEGFTWKEINRRLNGIGYTVDHIIISPNQIPNTNIPALRDRVFIICYRSDLYGSNIELFNDNKLPRISTSIYIGKGGNKRLNPKYFCNDGKHDLEEDRLKTLEIWDDFRKRIIESGGQMISPIWPHYFDDSDISSEPKWKQTIINRNRSFYMQNKKTIDKWMKDHRKHYSKLFLSDRKLEWNAGDRIDSIFDGIIQFRPSGVRVKYPSDIPTLVAINQTPIIGFERRYMTPDEMRKLYGFKKLNFGSQHEKQTYKQLGNTVSVDVVEYLLLHMLRRNGYE